MVMKTTAIISQTHTGHTQLATGRRKGMGIRGHLRILPTMASNPKKHHTVDILLFLE